MKFDTNTISASNSIYIYIYIYTVHFELPRSRHYTARGRRL